MTKTTNPTALATAAGLFQIGDRVSVTLPQTGEVPASGTVQKAANGWFVILLDQPECFPLSKAGIVSARKDRMAALAPVESQQDEGEDTDTDDAGETDEVEEALEEAETAASKMAEALRKARVHYQKTRRPQGAASADCADLIAKELRDYEPLEVAGLADRCFDLPKGFHAERYAHLNMGQIRMNSGNKIRAAYKKGDDAIRARIAFVLGLDQDEHDDQPDGTDVAEMAANAE